MNKGLRNEIVTLLGLTALGCLAFKKPRAAVGLGLAAGALAFAGSSKLKNFRGQSVIITGGSRGLGLALAKELVQDGALLTLLARDENELERARRLLCFERTDAKLLLIPCDVTKEDDLARALAESISHWGHVDMLVNNAGAILVGPFDSMRREDFEAQMELHLYAVLQAVQLILPHFRECGEGRIVNICSMGGRLAVPHMLPYDTSKFALAGFSQGLAAELSREGIQVTTVYPSLMNTGAPIQAVFKGDTEKEYDWFATGDNFPGLSMAAPLAARRILRAVLDGKTHFTPSGRWRVRMGLASLFPELTTHALSLVNRVLPRNASTNYRTGADSNAVFNRKRWNGFLKKRAAKAEQSLNQEAKSNAKFNAGLLH